MSWCLIAVILGLILLAYGIATKVKLETPFGTAGGSIGAVLLVIGVVAGILGYCPA